MDGFDDLLASSRRALEDNPFEDPFAKQRSSSPDPWGTPFASHVDETPTGYPTQPTYSEPAHDTYEQPATPKPESPPSATEPLDIASANADEVDAPTGFPASKSGFRQVAPSSPEIIAPVPEVAPGTPKTEVTPPPRPKTPSPVQASAPSTPTTKAEPLAQTADTAPDPAPPTPPAQPGFRDFNEPPKPPTPPPAASTLSPPASASSSVFSPLDQPLQHSFAGLALGGETAGGWHTATSSAFVNDREPSSSTAGWHSHSREASVDDDDDDDRPLQDIVDKTREQNAKLADEVRTLYLLVTRECLHLF